MGPEGNDAGRRNIRGGRLRGIVQSGLGGDVHFLSTVAVRVPRNPWVLMSVRRA